MLIARSMSECAPGRHQCTQVTGGTTRNKNAPTGCGKAGKVRQPPKRLVFSVNGACALHP